jgi:hypothetical protein
VTRHGSAFGFSNVWSWSRAMIRAARITNDLQRF